MRIQAMRTIRAATAAAALALLCATLAGCEEKVTLENFQAIELGMAKSDVERILGGGKDESPSAGMGISSEGLPTGGRTPDKVFVWTSSDGSKIIVTFAEGKVVQKRQEGLE